MADDNLDTQDNHDPTTEPEPTPTERRDRARKAAPSPDPEPTEGDDDLETIRAKLRKAEAEAREANRNNKAIRLKLEDFERERREAEDAKLSEADRLKKDRDDAARKAAEAERIAAEKADELTRFKVDLEIERAAHAAGFAEPADVPKLIDRNRIVTDPETGEVDRKSVKDAVDRLAKDRPNYLAGVHRGGGTPVRDASGRRGGPQPDRIGGGLTLEQRAEQQLLNTGGYHRL